MKAGEATRAKSTDAARPEGGRTDHQTRSSGTWNLGSE